MRKGVLLLALTLMMMSLYVPGKAQQPQSIKKDVVSVLPGVKLLDSVEYTLNGPAQPTQLESGIRIMETPKAQTSQITPISIQLSTEKVRGAFIIGFDSTLTVSKSWLEADNNHYDTTTFKLPAGLSVMELISKLPDVKIGDDGIITAIGGKPVIQLLFDWTQIYPKYQPLIEDLKSEALQEPDKYILDKGGVIVQIVDQSEGGVKITINYHPILEVVEDGYIINGKKVTKIFITG